MAPEYQGQSLRCPFCPFGSHNFEKLDRHVGRAHAEQRLREDETSQPAGSRLNDFELAQLLAFEEAGLPSELALPDRPTVPAYRGLEQAEVAKKHSLPSSPSESAAEAPWIECVCGESVHFLELEAHSDMHAQENLSIDDADLPSNVQLSTLPSTVEPPLQTISESFSTGISSSLRNHAHLLPKTPPSSGKRRGPSLKEFFLGTPVSPKRKSPYKAVSTKQGKTKRLGVSHSRTLSEAQLTCPARRIGPVCT